MLNDLSQYPNMQTDPEMMYSLASRIKARAKAIGDTWGSDSTQESLSNKLNEMGNTILIANGGRSL